MSNQSKPDKQSRGIILRRMLITLVFLEQPRTIKELAERLGIRKWGAHLYLNSFRKVGFPIESRERKILGKGLNPMEHWINCNGIVVLETCQMWAKLRGM